MRRGWNKVKVVCMSRGTATMGLIIGQFEKNLIYNSDKNAQFPFRCLHARFLLIYAVCFSKIIEIVGWC